MVFLRWCKKRLQQLLCDHKNRRSSIFGVFCNDCGLMIVKEREKEGDEKDERRTN